MSDVAFMVATAIVVAVGVALRLLLPRDRPFAARKAGAEQAAG